MEIKDYYALPLNERWPAMREHWMKSFADMPLKDFTVIAAMRDLLDDIHGIHRHSGRATPPDDIKSLWTEDERTAIAMNIEKWSRNP